MFMLHSPPTPIQCALEQTPKRLDIESLSESEEFLLVKTGDKEVCECVPYFVRPCSGHVSNPFH